MIESINNDAFVSETADEFSKSGKWHELRAVLIAEEDGEYSIMSMNLPGVASQGANREEAISNLREAYQGVKESYESIGKPIPWEQVDPSDWEDFRGTEIRILVNA